MIVVSGYGYDYHLNMAVLLQMMMDSLECCLLSADVVGVSVGVAVLSGR